MKCPRCQHEVVEARAFCPSCHVRLPRALIDCLGTPHPQPSAQPRAVAIDPDAVLLRSGDLVADRFRLGRELGRGSIGIVYEAADVLSGERVAVRVVYSALCARPEVRAAYREALASWRSIQDKRVVAVLARGDHGAEFHVMEFVESPDLSATLARTVAGGAAMEYRALYPLIAGIAKALGHGRHGRGHRNLTPHNVFVTRDGTPKVSDFGLAAILPPAERVAHAEHAGTLHYLAPETRRDPRSVDARADVFALGVLTYELATATRLDGTARRAGPVAKTPRANEAFERLIARATDPDPSRRPPNADAFAFELARAFQSAPSRSPSAPTEDARPSRPRLTPPVERVIDSPRAEAAAAYERGDLVEAARIAEAALGDGAVDTEMELVAARAEAALKERADQRAKLLEVHRERAREREAAGDPRGAADHLRRLLALDPSAEERAGIGARLAAIAGSAPPRRTRWPQVVALSSGAAILIAAAMLYYFVFAR